MMMNKCQCPTRALSHFYEFILGFRDTGIDCVNALHGLYPISTNFIAYSVIHYGNVSMPDTGLIPFLQPNERKIQPQMKWCQCPTRALSHFYEI